MIRRIALLCAPTRVIHVVTAVITAKGEYMIVNTEQTETAPASAAETKPKTARVAKRGAPVAPKKGKTRKKASPAKKAPKGAKKAEPARDGSKASKILEL